MNSDLLASLACQRADKAANNHEDAIDNPLFRLWDVPEDSKPGQEQAEQSDCQNNGYEVEVHAKYPDAPGPLLTRGQVIPRRGRDNHRLATNPMTVGVLLLLLRQKWLIPVDCVRKRVAIQFRAVELTQDDRAATFSDFEFRHECLLDEMESGESRILLDNIP